MIDICRKAAQGLKSLANVLKTFFFSFWRVGGWIIITIYVKNCRFKHICNDDAGIERNSKNKAIVGSKLCPQWCFV